MYRQHLVATKSENHKSKDAPKTIESENPVNILADHYDPLGYSTSEKNLKNRSYIQRKLESYSIKLMKRKL